MHRTLSLAFVEQGFVLQKYLGPSHSQVDFLLRGELPIGWKVCYSSKKLHPFPVGSIVSGSGSRVSITLPVWFTPFPPWLVSVPGAVHPSVIPVNHFSFSMLTSAPWTALGVVVVLLLFILPICILPRCSFLCNCWAAGFCASVLGGHWSHVLS